MQGDRYLVRFEQISKDRRPSTSNLKPLPFNWDPKKPTPLVARGVAPGLYRISIAEVSLLESDAASEPSANEAWVLITTPVRFAKAAPSFSAAQDVTKQWGTDVKQTAVRAFLRASLDFMTGQNTPSRN
jgi:hypothetical protein